MRAEGNMSMLLLALSGLSALMGAVSFFRPGIGLFFVDPARRTPGNGVRFWLLLAMLFWGSFRLFHITDIHAIELIVIFALAVFASKFCRRSLVLPALRRKRSLSAHSVVGFALGLAFHPFLQGNMVRIVQQYEWKFLVVLVPAFLLALLYDLLAGKFFGFLNRLIGDSLGEALNKKVFGFLSRLLGAVGDSVLILSGMLVSVMLASVVFAGSFAPHQLLPPLLMLYCCLMMSDIITRILEGELRSGDQTAAV
jgi:hypothetical protein